MASNHNTSPVAHPMLIVDDERDVLESLAAVFRASGYSVETASTGAEAMDIYRRHRHPIVVCDYSLPDVEGLALFKGFREVLPDVQVIMVTGKGTIDIAVEAMKAGMFDFVTKPVAPDRIIQLVNRAGTLYDALNENRKLRAAVSRMSDHYIVGNHQAIKDVHRMINTVAPTDATVLIEGESGTGKELVASLLHKKSPRSNGPFVAVDCGAIPEGLLESELFGYEKGAFTGAVSQVKGKFERASGGTLFLDEITSLPLNAQAKLLRVLQEKCVERLGGQKTIPVDIRLVAATNVDLREAVSNRQFRDDLFYRLNIVNIKVPPLRHRTSDIPLLAEHFIQKYKTKLKSRVTGLTDDAIKSMASYSWPGNVRELENSIEHAMIMASDNLISSSDLPKLSEEPHPVSRLEEAEKGLIVQALRESGGNKVQAARILGIPRSSLYSKLQKYGLQSA